MPRLHVTLPDGSDTTHELTEEHITLGRVSDNAIQIEHASVSSHHAELRREGEEYRLTDIGSTNGTHLNGDVLAENVERPLHHGDVIIFGSVTVRYLAQAESEAQPLPVEAEPQLAPATTSVPPVDFSNASPFKKRGAERDKVALAVYAFAVLGLLSAGAAIYLTMQIQAPTPT